MALVARLLRTRSDMPFERDESSRFIPWIVALMVYLACLALAGALVAGSMATRWSRGLTGTFTVQIMPRDDVDAKTRDARTEAVVALLRETPGVAHAEVLSEQRLAALLEPWLGPGAAKDLPLPVLIAGQLAPGAAVDLRALGSRLAAAVPGALLDDHQQWLDRAMSLARSAVLLAALVLVLVGAAAAIATVFGTRTALAIHRNVIEVMHLIGAQDTYVARQFQIHALEIGLRGGIAGLGGALVTLLVLAYGIGPLGASPLPDFALAPWQWALLVLPPPAAAVIAMLTARVTVLRALARMV